jgi:hypothetical protein
MIPRAFAIVLAFLFAFASPTVALRAQQDPTVALSKQEQASAKFKDLSERMQKLMVVLQKSDPEDSKILSTGLQYAQEKKMTARLDKCGDLLKQERWDEALVYMADLRKDLGTLLDLLQNRNTDLRKLLEEIQRLEAFKNRVDELAKEQAKEKADSARTEELQKHLADVEAKKKAVEALLAEQQKLRAETNELGLQAAAEATKPLADKEGELQQKTEQLAKDLEATEKKNEELKKPEAGKPGEKGEPKDGKPSAGSPGAGSCSGSAGKAAQSMGKAEQQLGDKKPEPSLKDQDQAIEELKQTAKQLDEMAEEAKRELLKLPFEQQAKNQEKTQNATDTLSKDMEKSEQPGEHGEPPDATPGKKRVQQAVPKQRAAAGQLKEYVPAKQKQQDAKEDLEAAKKELEDALAQLRQQLQDEVLRALEERFTAMLARQRDLSASTKTLDATRNNILTASGALPQAIADKLTELSVGESDLRMEAADALKLLEEDATTAVFPPMVEQLRDDLGACADRLKAQDSGAGTQQAQRDVEELLELLINALRKTIERKECGH